MKYKKKSDFKNYSEPVQNALFYIRQHFQQNINLADVASHIGFAPSYFSKLFHRTVGQTFVAYLSELRVSFATLMLAKTDVSIKEVCTKSGFGTFSHFQQCFKKKYGCTPSEYRNVPRDGDDIAFIAPPDFKIPGAQ